MMPRLSPRSTMLPETKPANQPGKVSQQISNPIDGIAAFDRANHKINPTRLMLLPSCEKRLASQRFRKEGCRSTARGVLRSHTPAIPAAELPMNLSEETSPH